MPSEPAPTPSPAPITLVDARPEGYIHADAYADLIEAIAHGLTSLGHPIRRARGLAALGPRCILFGAHLLPRPLPLPADLVIFNTEHVTAPMLDAAYFDLLRPHTVWDYSADNAAALAARLGRPVRHVPFFPAPAHRRVLPAAKDIDVLFYGSMNDRRRAVLDGLAAAGLRVEAGFGVYGAALDALIGRARLAINIHYYEPGHFEVLRVGYLLANRVPVLSEANPGETVDPDLAVGLALAPHDRLVETARALLADPARLDALAAAGHAAFAARDATAALGPAVADAWSATLPDHLVIGAGRHFDPAALNTDIDPAWHPDIPLDIAAPDLFAATRPSRRFGQVRLARGQFRRITASHVLQFVRDLPAAMANCLALLRDGGEFHVTVPYDLSHGAWQDPGHVRAFNERSWLYVTDWHWYLGWTEARFDLISLDFVRSPLGDRLQAEGMDAETLLRTPRAIDDMRAVLRRRPLTEAERAEAARQRGEYRRAPPADA